MAEERIFAVQGKLAEILRRSESYRQCRQIFIDPSLLLRQARVNALLDGKELIMPGAGLKEGFYLLKPFQVPFKNLVMAVTYVGLERYGRRLAAADISSLHISLLVGESFAVDRQGHRLGGGQGFFDLAIALLGEMNGLADGCQAVAAIDDPARVVEKIPQDPWDVKCGEILAPDGIEELFDSSSVPEIFWDDIPPERIKRISPLRRLLASGK
ncbi:MAG: 5-formyltetrahydrofolate cyclo-ligase [Thermodesulfobacteriota bacterium]